MTAPKQRACVRARCVRARGGCLCQQIAVTAASAGRRHVIIINIIIIVVVIKELSSSLLDSPWARGNKKKGMMAGGCVGGGATPSSRPVQGAVPAPLALSLDSLVRERERGGEWQGPCGGAGWARAAPKKHKVKQRSRHNMKGASELWLAALLFRCCCFESGWRGMP